VTRDEYEKRDLRLTEDIEEAYRAFNRARDLWDGLCKERRNLRWQWSQQQDAKKEK
jgi:hypothetical protein